MIDTPYTDEATLRCIECDEQFTTSADGDGDMTFDGVEDHALDAHPEGAWEFTIVDLPGGQRDD